MKQLVLTLLLSVGVGLTLMGSPAQVCDDNNTQNNVVVTNCENLSQDAGSMAVVQERPNIPESMVRIGMKHECKKKIDVSKQTGPNRAPKRMMKKKILEWKQLSMDSFVIKDPFGDNTNGIGNNPRNYPPKK